MTIIVLTCLLASIMSIGISEKVYTLNNERNDVSEVNTAHYKGEYLSSGEFKPQVWGLKTDLSHANASILGEDDQAHSGTSVAGLGDVNGDGFGDILIGAPGMNDSKGRCFLFFGRSSDDWYKDMGLSEANVTFIPDAGGLDTEGCLFGYATAGAGDINGDGYNDILIGAPNQKEDEYYPPWVYAGRAYAYLGRPTEDWSTNMTLEDANVVFRGSNEFWRFGFSVSSAGNFNSDVHGGNGNDIDDILIGAWGAEDGTNDLYTGRTYLFCGNPAWSPFDHYTIDLDILDGDEPIVYLYGEDASDFSGFAVTGVGDVNNDQYDDIVIGAPHDEEGGTDAGQVYLIFGRPVTDFITIPLSAADASFLGEDEGDQVGRSVSGAGDVNNDGYNDILLGAPYNEEGGTDAGQAYLIFGKPTNQWQSDISLSQANASFIGEDSSDLAGSSVTGVGDLNKDGYSDILIGAPGDEEGGTDAGQTYLILGRSTANWGMNMNLFEANASFVGERSFAQSGLAVAGAGDVDNDGFGDILIGAPNDDEGEIGSGQTYLILATPPTLTINSPVPIIYTTNTITVDLSGNADYFWYYIVDVDLENQTWISPVQRNLTDGTYVLHAFANNTVGPYAGAVVNSSVTFSIDTTPPIVVIDSPLPLSYPDSTVSISFSGEAEHYWYYILNLDSMNQSWSSNTLRTFEDGTYTLHAYGNDSVGNEGHVIRIFIIDTTPPLIDSPGDVTIEEGNCSCNITWTPIDTDPSSFLVTRDLVKVVGGPWSGEQISVSVSNLPVGSYQYTCTVYDNVGNSASDTVNVTIISSSATIDTTNPSLDHPEDLTYEEGSIGHTLKWSPMDANPESFRVEMDGIWVAGGPWHGEPIIISLDGLVTGTYEFICTVYDQADNYVDDSVLVTIIDTTPPKIDHPPDIVYIEGVSSNEIIWYPSDSHPATYQITRNGTILENDPWNGGSLSISISGLTPGDFIFICMVTDQSGNQNSDEVLVSVSATPVSTTIWPSLVLLLPAFGVLVVLRKKLGRQENL